RQRPVQIIFAGKPHPEDGLGAKLFEEIAAVARRPEFSGKVVLLEGYDIEMARHLVQGVDLWLNNPRRPLEACGTSGQKVPINCGLNLSILDGWWDEGYAPEAGFAFGKPIEYRDTDKQDREDRDDLYRVLTRDVLPLYFERGRDGLPRAWLEKVKSAMALLVPRFSSAQMLSDYARQLYRPAAAGGRELRTGRAKAAHALADWRAKVERSWPLAHVVSASRTAGGRRAEVEIFTSALGPSELAAEVAHDGSQEAVKAKAVRLGVVRYTFSLPPRAPARLLVWPHHGALSQPPGMVSLE